MEPFKKVTGSELAGIKQQAGLLTDIQAKYRS